MRIREDLTPHRVGLHQQGPQPGGLPQEGPQPEDLLQEGPQPEEPQPDGPQPEDLLQEGPQPEEPQPEDLPQVSRERTRVRTAQTNLKCADALYYSYKLVVVHN